MLKEVSLNAGQCCHRELLSTSNSAKREEVGFCSRIIFLLEVCTFFQSLHGPCSLVDRRAGGAQMLKGLLAQIPLVVFFASNLTSGEVRGPDRLQFLFKLGDSIFAWRADL